MRHSIRHALLQRDLPSGFLLRRVHKHLRAALHQAFHRQVRLLRRLPSSLLKRGHRQAHSTTAQKGGCLDALIRRRHPLLHGVPDPLIRIDPKILQSRQPQKKNAIRPRHDRKRDRRQRCRPPRSHERQLQRNSALRDGNFLSRRRDGLPRPERKRNAHLHTWERTLHHFHDRQRQTREMSARVQDGSKCNGSPRALARKAQLSGNILVLELHGHFIRISRRRDPHLTPRPRKLRRRRRPRGLKRHGGRISRPTSRPRTYFPCVTY